jgi:hypothetical protein
VCYSHTSSPFGSGSAIAGDKVNYDLVARSSRTDTRFNASAVKSLSDEQLTGALNDPASVSSWLLICKADISLVAALRQERDAISREIAKDYGRLRDAPVTLIRQYNTVSARYHRTLTSLSEEWLRQDPTRTGSRGLDTQRGLEGDVADSSWVPIEEVVRAPADILC